MKNINKYISLLLKLPKAELVSNDREVVCRCQYCQDSKNPDSKHFYISIPTDNKPSFFNCFKCNSHGIVTNKVLAEWNLHDTDVYIDLLRYNASIMKLPQNSIYVDNEIYNVANTFSDTPISELKLRYINARLGIKLTLSDVISNKIVLNLDEVISYNKLNLSRHKNIVSELSNYFIGFLSCDNAFINLRRIVDKGIVYEKIDKRYVYYNLVNKYDNTHKYYIIPNELNTNYPIDIRLCEGPLDALSIKYNLTNGLLNQVYMAIGGSGYTIALRYILLSLGVPNINVHVYIDSDKDNQRNINKIANSIYGLGIPLYIHRNLIGKDMGVPVSNIKESITQIL